MSHTKFIHRLSAPASSTSQSISAHTNRFSLQFRAMRKESIHPSSVLVAIEQILKCINDITSQTMCSTVFTTFIIWTVSIMLGT